MIWWHNDFSSSASDRNLELSKSGKLHSTAKNRTEYEVSSILLMLNYLWHMHDFDVMSLEGRLDNFAYQTEKLSLHELKIFRVHIIFWIYWSLMEAKVLIIKIQVRMPDTTLNSRYSLEDDVRTKLFWHAYISFCIASSCACLQTSLAEESNTRFCSLDLLKMLVFWQIKQLQMHLHQENSFSAGEGNWLSFQYFYLLDIDIFLLRYVARHTASLSSYHIAFY